MKAAMPPARPRAARLRAEAQSRIAGPAALIERGAGDLAHELRVHQIELEMQNEELRRAQVALEAARDRYVDLYDFAPVGYLTLSAEGVVCEANLTAAALLDVARARLVGSRFASRVAPDDRDRWHRQALRLLHRDGPGRIELCLLGRGAKAFHGLIDAGRVTAPDAAPRLRLALTDISERKHAEAALRLAATAFDTQEGIMITDARGVIERVNRAFTRITGYAADEAVGQTPGLMKSGRHDAGYFGAMWDSLRRSGTWQGEVWNRRKCGEAYPAWLTITAVRDDDGVLVHYVSTMTDITERKQRDEEIARLAFYDPLTGLPNRRLLKDRLEQSLAVSGRLQREGALMFIDLDNFKLINDTLGHDKGDQLLQQVAQRLGGCLRESDTVARPGGDEFVVILAPDPAAPAAEVAWHVRSVAEKILAALNQPYQLAGYACRSGASIGIALFSGHARAAEDLLMHADQAMYQAKAAGRNTVRFFDETVQQALQQRSALADEMRQALQQGEFALHFQPVVDREQRLIGAEALLRWQHPQRGWVLPGEFIPIAEETGLIHALGLWVLESACERLSAWAADPWMAGLKLSVNVSAHQFREGRFLQEVIGVLDRSQIDPTRLEIELTEGVMLEDVEDAIAKMSQLRARGVCLALDDFGTGYASLSYLKRLPLDQLKIDRAFVRDVLDSPADAAIIRTVVALGHDLGLTVIAEGVETSAQYDCLAGLGCGGFQGNVFGAAAPERALHERAHLQPPRR
jgi:diguanylate cyclase (GGDEF)-like protein/PAS domain S-box-containing protein